MPRNPKPKRKPKFAPYKSGLEKRVSLMLSKAFVYEDPGTRVDYVVKRKYSPDFTHPAKPWLILEVKGYFNKRANDALKYRSIKESNPDKRVVFLFSNPNKKYGLRRKDGSAMTYREWCRKYGFLCYAVDKLPPRLKRGDVTKAWVDAEIKRQAKV